MTSEISCAMQRRQSFAVSLINFSTVVQKMVQLRKRLREGICLGSKSYHVQLLVSGCEMNWRAASVVLRDVVGISRHDLGELLRIPDPSTCVKCKWWILWRRWVATTS